MIDKLLTVFPYWLVMVSIAGYLYRKEKKLSKELIWASFRNAIQLIFLALALEIIFSTSIFMVSLGVALLMTLNSSVQMISRSNTKKFNLFRITFFSHVLSIWPIAFLFSFDESKGSWAEPRFLLPLMGMILGSTLSGVSIALTHFHQSFRDKNGEIITKLSLGASIDEATRKFFYQALRAGMTPQINSMIAMGIVSIPGMMAGQIISNASAMEAAIVQMKMMISISIGTVLCTHVCLHFLRKKLFLPTGELCLK